MKVIKNNLRTSLVICAKNEAGTIGPIIHQSQKYVNEILVIDGHSVDDTREVAKDYEVRVFIDNGKGKGAGMRLGIEKAEGSIVVFIDADGSHDPRDIPRLIEPIQHNKANLVVASRGKGGSDELSGSLEKNIRLIGSSIITLIINLRYGTKLTDTQNGFRAVKRDVLQQLVLEENIFTIEQEMIMKALKKKYTIMEISSHEYARKQGKSNINLWTMSWRYLWCLLKNLI